MVAANEIELESRIILADVVDQDFKLEKSQEFTIIIDSFQSDIKCQPQIIANRAHIWLKGYATVYCTGLPIFLGKNETKELNF